MPVSKHDLKHFSKSDLPGFAGGPFMNFQTLFNEFEMLLILKCVFNDSEMLFNGFEMFCL